MKRILLALSVLALFATALPRSVSGQVSVDFFYNNLGGGSWVEVDNYGYCWQPGVAVSNRNWRPYSDGYWAHTDVGWTWVSYEDFGWTTYHYGRWTRLSDHGWIWVPGQEWGPAWVSWRTGGDYVGWAPLPPHGETIYEGRPISGRVDIDFDIGPMYYNFVDVRYIGEPVLRDRIFAPQQNLTIINNTVNVTNISYSNSVVYNNGPDYNMLSRYSVRPIQKLKLERQANLSPDQALQAGVITKVQGDKLMVAAPAKLQKPAQGLAPKEFKTKIKQAKIERGWAGVDDPNVKAKLQQKMKSEDAKNVPPPTIQPKAGADAQVGASPAGAPGSSPAVGPTDANAAGSAAVGGAGKGKGKGKNRGQDQQPGGDPTDTTAAGSAAVGDAEKGKGKGKKNRGQDPQPEGAPALGSPGSSISQETASDDGAGKKGAKGKKGQRGLQDSPPQDAPPAATGQVDQGAGAAGADMGQPSGKGKGKGKKSQLDAGPADVQGGDPASQQGQGGEKKRKRAEQQLEGSSLGAPPSPDQGAQGGPPADQGGGRKAQKRLERQQGEPQMQGQPQGGPPAGDGQQGQGQGGQGKGGGKKKNKQQQEAEPSPAP